jgi:nucleotide-binding universal stress UspA family protein
MKMTIVPVDFSDHTEISCRYALALAISEGAGIVLFHSFFDQLYFSDGGLNTGFESGIMLTDEIIMDFYKQKELKLNQLKEKLLEEAHREYHSSVEISCRMESGDPEVQILNAIKEIEPDLIVMGSGGMGKKGLLSGSVARHLIDNTSVPVIAVPGMSGLLPVKHVIYMTAFDDADRNVIYKIDEVLKKQGVKIHCLHLVHGESKLMAEKKMIDLSSSPLSKEFEGRISFHIIENKDYRECLNDFIKSNDIGLIAFIPHRRNIFRNIFYQGISKKDLFLTNIPVMAIKPLNN